MSLDDPAERYVPELRDLRYPTTDSPRITVRHLLTHSEGFPEDNPWGDQQLSESEAEFRMLRDGIPFSNTPGVASEYSNYGFRDPRAHRVTRLGQALRRICRG